MNIVQTGNFGYTVKIARETFCNRFEPILKDSSSKETNRTVVH